MRVPTDATALSRQNFSHTKPQSWKANASALLVGAADEMLLDVRDDES